MGPLVPRSAGSAGDSAVGAAGWTGAAPVSPVGAPFSASVVSSSSRSMSAYSAGMPSSSAPATGSGSGVPSSSLLSSGSSEESSWSGCWSSSSSSSSRPRRSSSHSSRAGTSVVLADRVSSSMASAKCWSVKPWSLMGRPEPGRTMVSSGPAQWRVQPLSGARSAVPLDVTTAPATCGSAVIRSNSASLSASSGSSAAMRMWGVHEPPASSLRRAVRRVGAPSAARARRWSAVWLVSSDTASARVSVRATRSGTASSRPRAVFSSAVISKWPGRGVLASSTAMAWRTWRAWSASPSRWRTPTYSRSTRTRRPAPSQPRETRAG